MVGNTAFIISLFTENKSSIVIGVLNLFMIRDVFRKDHSLNP